MTIACRYSWYREQSVAAEFIEYASSSRTATVRPNEKVGTEQNVRIY